MKSPDALMSDIDKLYEETLENFKSNRSGRVRRQVRNVLDLIGLSSRETILEVGVATGKFTSMMTRANRVFALDVSIENLKRAEKAVKGMGDISSLRCIAADCRAIPFADLLFDKIVAIDIIEHLKDAVFDIFCAEAYRVLKPGGQICLYTPNLLHPYEFARPFRPVMRMEHVGVRTRASICRSLKGHNFIVEKSHFNNLFRRISVKAKKG